MLARLVLLALLGAVAVADVPADLITYLPGIPYVPPFRMYSGYLNGGQNNGSTNNMFYWHVGYSFPDQDDGSQPVIFWFNGGPGCSSLGGFFTENGPFWPSPDGVTLFENVYSWNKVGHMVYIESPPGTGFSYSDNLNYKWDDDSTSLINVNAINDFFKKYPEHANRTFFLTGESYAGVYIPTVTGRIIDWIKAGNFSNNNFGGFAIGNGYMDQPRLFNALMNYNYYHGFFGQSEWAQVKSLCCGGANTDGDNCDFFWPLYNATDLSNPCVNLTFWLGDYIPDFTIPDPYNVYQSCYTTQNLAAGMSHAYKHTAKALPHIRRFLEKNYPQSALLGNGTFPTYQYGINTDSSDHQNGFPCYSGNANFLYLGRSDVQAALHVSPIWQSWKKGIWTDCSDLVTSTYKNIYMELGSQFDYALQPFNAPGMPMQTTRLMIYNGDVDTVCNFLGDEWFGHAVASRNNLTTNIIKRNHWNYMTQLAGEAESLGTMKGQPRLDILTVNGAGHFVPMDRSGPALQMLYNFVWNRQNYTLPAPIDTSYRATNPPSSAWTNVPSLGTTPASAANDKVAVLPSLPYVPPFDMYTGYLDGGMNSPTTYNHIFYWLNQYQYQDNDDTPLIVWMNGGPGCSSLGGLFTENGPFYAYKQGAYLFENPYAWNKVANMLYIESPPGVGFSYSDDLSTTWSDDTTSLVNVNALNDFFKRFPKFATRKWFITGESYGGKYVPTLSVRVKDWIEAGNFSNPNFQGFAIGNGCTDDDVLFNGEINYLYYHGFFGQQAWNNLLGVCCPGGTNARGDMCDFGRPNTTQQCNAQLDVVYDGAYRNIPDPYNVYQSCYATTSSLLMYKSRHAKRPQLFDRLVDSSATAKEKLGVVQPSQLYAQPNFNYNSTDALQGFPCWDDSANAAYLSRPDVQAAIHVSPVWQNWKRGQWSDCSNLRYTTNYASMQSQFVYLLQGITPQGQATRPLHLMLYNGDVDIVCNFLGEEWFGHNVVNASANQSPVGQRQPWFYGGQLAGYQETFTNFDILTVDGAGHFVPMDRPGAALQMLNNYVRNTQNYTAPYQMPTSS